MTERSLQVTYRKGRPFAAYLHLSHATGDKSARTVATPDGLLVVDYNSAGQPVGVEITAPQAVSLERVNELLSSLDQPPLADHEFRPCCSLRLRPARELPTLDRVAVYCADIGSVAARRFGWASVGPVGSNGGDDMQQLAAAVADDLRSGRPVALGFECPLFVPLAVKPDALTSARMGEGNRPWCAGAGAGALATGLVQVVWILREIRRMAPVECEATFDWLEFSEGRASLFLWEAFVSGASKRDGHSADARAAVEAFTAALSTAPPTSAIKAGPETFSLIGAALLRSGWSDDHELLHRPCLVVRAAPRSAGPRSGP